ncbi:MAG: twin-arginine translocation pathway signal protein [Devosiaceae bacterium]|nr:twin-arginine translocation pathway signal protein [Devosiaceae bacterium]
MLTIAKFMRLILVGLSLILLSSGSFAQNLNLQNIYVTDPLTGVAIEGYDAVSYYTQEAPALGRPEYELSWNGVVWYFSNEANRAVFIRAPEIYAPQFGGHGTMSLSRGYLTDGKANIFALLGGRLFLFYSSSNKDAFMLSQKTAYIKARNNWEFLSSRLIPAE